VGGDQIIVEDMPNITANNYPSVKKKTIPLLKKGKPSVSYNELVCAPKLASRAKDSQTPMQLASHIDKGFISEDTDANSRLSALTNNQKVNMKR
jgi:hypothetical protein